MSWKVHGTDDVFAELRGLCSNSYRMYDPSEYRYYYDHDCETYECAVEEAAREYERLLRHCDHQRQELAKLRHPIEGEVMNERTKTEQGSSITDELREYAQRYKNSHDAWSGIGDDLDQIANRIDEHHAKERDKAYDEGVNDGIDADKEAMGYVKLPVDADGVPIHVGDEMEGVDKYNSLKKVMGKVITVSFESDGIVDVAIRAWNSDGKSWHRAYLDPNASVYHHHHEPTVEDVLREFAQAMNENMGMYTGEAIDADEWRYADNKTIAEYAAKLRLADDGEE